ncbi:hypothetical protein M472_19225 [Sphingobacterium paucimobilis HER1398]|uniref:Uncharacterized protein n=1 Tax=Sphingobacterium paucimobilis HER1398 TaxID=1346330 RepID=U2I040_9SPHI|nr:hypothetical protein M472_19225 [Sphingobacterium paucimobilis HER1398]
MVSAWVAGMSVAFSNAMVSVVLPVQYVPEMTIRFMMFWIGYWLRGTGYASLVTGYA